MSATMTFRLTEISVGSETATVSLRQITDITQPSWSGPLHPNRLALDELLQTRAQTHGDYRETAEIAQRLKAVMRQSPNWHLLTASMRESLDMDAAKTARILAGDPFEIDHWSDKEGYRELVRQEIKRR